MATLSGSTQERSDLRCSLCRQKNAFHCEHNTPYRDQFLDGYGQEKPHNQRDSHRKSSNTNNYPVVNNRTHDIDSNADVRYQQGRRSDHNTFPNSNGSKKQKKKKKKKACVIS